MLGTIQIYQSVRISAFRLVGLEEGEKMKKRKIYKTKGYTHFDTRKADYWKYINNIKK